MRRTVIQFLLIGAVTLAGAQDRVAGPVSGYVFDGAAHALRPILGIPGASTVGAALHVGSELSAAYVSPRLDSALVADPNGARFVRLNGSSAPQVALDGLAVPERVAYSPTGSAAALLAAGRLAIVLGLPDAPALAGNLDVTTMLRQDRYAAARIRPGSSMTSFAVSDDGKFVLAAEGGAVRLLGVAGENFRVAPVGARALVAFAPGGHDAAVADASGAVLFLRDVTGSSVTRTLASAVADSSIPAGIAFAADGARLFVASAGVRAVSAFDLATGNRTSITCDCDPAGLFPMGDLFRLNEAGASPLWLLDARSAAPRVVFVPAGTD